LRYGLRRPEALARLLSKLPQVKVLDIEYGDVCCGGPEFLMQQAEMSEKILSLKVNGIRQASAPILLSTSGGCIMTMDYALRSSGVSTVVMHPVELLAASYGYHTSSARAAMLC
jgi:Fe-S oxidoreductase